MAVTSQAGIDEGVLVAQAREGDTQAFNDLVRRYEGKIFRLAQHITQNREDAEDVLQETFLKAYEHLPEFHGDSKFYTWIVRIAVNEALMKLRKRKWDKTVWLDEPVNTGEDTVAREIAVWEDNPEQRYSKVELQDILDKAVNGLAPPYRTVFMLRDVEAPAAQVFLFKTAREAERYRGGGPIQTGREHVSLIVSTETPREDFQQRLARLLIEANTDRMPAGLERGLIALFGTLDVTGIRISLGKPPAQRDKDWARMHMLAADPQYYGKLGVLFYNLQKGAEDDPAYRNAFGKSKAEIEAEVARYLAAGNFPTASLPSRAMSAEHDYPDNPIESAAIQEKLTVLLHDQDLLAEYQALLAKGDTLSLRKAIELEPKQAAPRFLLAEREPDLKERVELLKAAL